MRSAGRNIIVVKKLNSFSDDKNMFWRCSSLVNVNLNLPEATDCMSMFDNCSDLVSIDLTLPKAINCAGMFYKCSDLVSVEYFFMIYGQNINDILKMIY